MKKKSLKRIIRNPMGIVFLREPEVKRLRVRPEQITAAVNTYADHRIITGEDVQAALRGLRLSALERKGAETFLRSFVGDPVRRLTQASIAIGENRIPRSLEDIDKRGESWRYTGQVRKKYMAAEKKLDDCLFYLYQRTLLKDMFAARGIPLSEERLRQIAKTKYVQPYDFLEQTYPVMREVISENRAMRKSTAQAAEQRKAVLTLSRDVLAGFELSPEERRQIGGFARHQLEAGREAANVIASVKSRALSAHNSRLRELLARQNLDVGILQQIASARISEASKEELKRQLVLLLAKNSVLPAEIVSFVAATVGRKPAAPGPEFPGIAASPKRYKVLGDKTMFFLGLERQKIPTAQIRRAVNVLERRAGSLPPAFFTELEASIRGVQDPQKIIRAAEQLVPQRRTWLEHGKEQRRRARVARIQDYSINRLLRMARARYVPREVVIGIRRALAQTTEKTLDERTGVEGMRHLILAELASRGFSGRVQSTGGLQMLVFNPRKNPQLSIVFETAYQQLVREGAVKEKRSAGLVGAYLSPERSDLLQKYHGIVRR